MFATVTSYSFDEQSSAEPGITKKSNITMVVTDKKADLISGLLYLIMFFLILFIAICEFI
jgi:hypothetical protein